MITLYAYSPSLTYPALIMSSPLQELDNALSQLSTVKEKAGKIASYLEKFGSPAAFHYPAGGNVDALEPDAPFSESAFYNLLLQHGVSSSDLRHAYSMLPSHSRLILDATPCAFIDHATREECLEGGTAFCTSCRLVTYCSKVCRILSVWT